MMRKITLTLVLGLSLLAACKKDEQIEPVAAPVAVTDTANLNNIELLASAHLLTRIDDDKKNYSILTYTNGLVTKMESKETGSALQTITFAYDTQKKLKTAKTQDGGMNYIYSGTSLTRVDFTSAGKVVASLKYTYKSGKVTEAVQYVKYGATEMPFLKLVYSYTGSDVTTTKTYGYDFQAAKYILSETLQTTYDNKKNATTSLAQLLQAFYQAYSVHNPVKEVTTDAKGKVTETNTYAYTYDSAGYPTTSTEKTVKPGTTAVTVKTKFTYK